MAADFGSASIDIPRLFAGFRRDHSNLIPLLQSLQQAIGYLPAEAITAAAEHLGLSETTVFSVASFYTQFKFQPPGRDTIKVCRGTACHVGGGERIIAELQRDLGIKPGETTPGGEYSLDTVACVGACALAPVVIINDEIFGRASPRQIIDELANHKPGAGCPCRD